LNPTVFLSRPAILSPAQERLGQCWVAALEAASLHVERLQRTSYEHDTWTQLRTTLQRVDGVIVLGFRQLSVNGGQSREDTAEELAQVTTWTSPWMQIEAGMALMHGLPVMAVPERGVAEGIFDRDRWTGQLFGTELEREPVGEPGRAWIDAVWRGTRHPAVGKTEIPDERTS
jgi:hypothetical protein